MSFLKRIFFKERPPIITATEVGYISSNCDVETYPLTSTETHIDNNINIDTNNTELYTNDSNNNNNYNNDNIPTIGEQRRQLNKTFNKATITKYLLAFIMIAGLIALAAVASTIDLSSAFSKGKSSQSMDEDINNIQPETPSAYKEGIISSTSDTNNPHVLGYDPETRKSSKKLYELMHDFDTAYYDDENMILGTNLFSENVYSRQPYVANGYIGSRIPNTGFGYALDTLNLFTDAEGSLNNGWPLRNRRYAGAFVSDFYSLQEKLNSTNFPELDNHGYSTVISSIPQWTNLQFSLDNGSIWFNPQEIDKTDVSNYQQNLSMKDGIVTTDMDWIDGMIHVKSEIWAHRKIYPLGMVSLEISLNVDSIPDGFESVDLDVWDVLDFNTSHRTVLNDIGYDDDGIYMVIEPDNVPYSNAALYSACTLQLENSTEEHPFQFDEDKDPLMNTNERISKVSHVTLSKANPKLTVHKYVGIMSTEYNNDEKNGGASNLDLATKVAMSSKGSYDLLLSTHKKAWYALYNDAFIEIPSDNLLEMTARSSLYQLLANTRTYNVSEERGLPLAVGGLSSDSYGGMVFWDSDIWVQPALLPFFPQIAKNINNYRNATHAQARLNAKQYGYPGAVYPWTSGRYANCTSAGPCVDYEYHINVDIAMATFSIYMNGGKDVDDNYLRYTTWPMVRDAAEFFTVYVKYNATLGKYETYNLTDPDEFADHINNGAFTNAGIKTLLKWATDIGNHLGEYVDPKWMEISHNIYIPRSKSNITLEYSGMNSSVEIKQADVTLMVYPLGYINDESILNNAIKDLYYYSERQSASGPAMTYPVFVAAASTLLNHGSSSQSYLYKSVLPYLRAPFAQFSEQSDDNFSTNGLTQPAFPFLTANGGFLQSILFGLTGIRYTYEVDEATKKINRVLRFNPVELPLLPGGIAIRNFKYMDQVLDIILNDHNGTIVHKSGGKPINIKVPNRKLIHDRDIDLFTRDEKRESLERRDQYEKEDPNDTSNDAKDSTKYGTSYVLHPGEELTIPLFKPELNIEGNIAESKQITNLTAGVPGDVGFSALDGNNYTHWQPADKKDNARLLIDLGEDNIKEIRKGMILWGQRPAKNISIAILPHTDTVENIFTNVSKILENSKNAEEYREGVIDLLNENNISVQSTSSTGEVEANTDLQSIISWKTDDFDEVLERFPRLGILGENFVTILQDYKIEPSEPYYEEVIKESLIEILPSNKTEFSIDYSRIHINSTRNNTEIGEWKKARYVLLTVHGTYDDDIDPKGATIKEIAFMEQ
ncbi:alpha,alpha-trehalase ATH1 NDAI_0A01370 [Naumovozyma dairenensis CBS 421]|uniref:alpha,alpha-trehalase n=1 Tax=Naumovozyma dairenensis (strain ATCC 10597 / BCRC 20456 / CBS 421 / NBRC 0211 / NRRL Y-12639) TaxID=1071378 RepID=G0W3A7_NAUDC|nr:hypothetical protein NDAI_0A01370 [Naumovozyma dairenensis CBS 421]CCD22295.1 hypothetical protein NDAI_0A01370 [Naumovozyma dairenensis CBS 421]